MLVLTGRGPALEAGFQSGLLKLLPLSPLPDRALAQVPGTPWGGRSLDDTLAVWICQQAGGNPLYAEALSQALQQADAILLDRDTARCAGLAWPRLCPCRCVNYCWPALKNYRSTTRCVKRAAVMGLSFESEGY